MGQGYVRAILPFALSLLLLFGCSPAQRVEEDPDPADADAIEETVPGQHIESSSASSSKQWEQKPPLTLASLAPYLGEWSSIWNTMIPGFVVSDMRLTSSNSLQATITDALVNHEDILTKQEEIDFPILFPSDDGKTVIYISPGDEPDTEVAVIRPEQNLYERHLYCGTPCGFDSAIWIDNDRVVITGFSEYHPPSGEERCSEGTICTFVPLLYLFDFGIKTVTRYEGQEVEAATFLNVEAE